MNRLMFGKLVVENNQVDRSAVLAGYRKHNERVRNFFPEGSFLEFNVEQGWVPLCNFLDADIPSVPFPYRNTGVDGPTKIIANAVGRLSLLPVAIAISGLIVAVLFLR
jgi:hypothetical protein